MSAAREQIMSRVRGALAPLSERAPLPDWDASLVALRQRSTGEDLWTLFAERLKAVNGTPLQDVAALVELLDRGGWHHGYCDATIWNEIKSAFPAHFVVETRFDRARVDEYKFGITPADGAIAETGTIILSDARTENRLTALAPWVHVAVVRLEQIHQDVTSAIASLPADPNVVWITGPSKTADVEGILIEGVHGPGIQAALRWR
ncbi:MAG TPA: LUD domain-containing protein [Opitutaceae bacterium]|nr:LUD domain-containing protein [Opitutaceae bacterium]